MDAAGVAFLKLPHHRHRRRALIRKQRYSLATTWESSDGSGVFVLLANQVKFSLVLGHLCPERGDENPTAAQNQKAVTAYLKGKQLLPFGFAVNELRRAR